MQTHLEIRAYGYISICVYRQCCDFCVEVYIWACGMCMCYDAWVVCIVVCRFTWWNFSGDDWVMALVHVHKCVPSLCWDVTVVLCAYVCEYLCVCVRENEGEREIGWGGDFSQPTGAGGKMSKWTDQFLLAPPCVTNKSCNSCEYADDRCRLVMDTVNWARMRSLLAGWSVRVRIQIRFVYPNTVRGCVHIYIYICVCVCMWRRDGGARRQRGKGAACLTARRHKCKDTVPWVIFKIFKIQEIGRKRVCLRAKLYIIQ